MVDIHLSNYENEPPKSVEGTAAFARCMNSQRYFSPVIC